MKQSNLSRNQTKTLLGIETSVWLINLTRLSRNQTKTLLGIETSAPETAGTV